MLRIKDHIVFFNHSVSKLPSCERRRELPPIQRSRNLNSLIEGGSQRLGAKYPYDQKTQKGFIGHGEIRVFTFACWATILSALHFGGLSGCGGSTEDVGGNADGGNACNITITEKAEAQALIQSFDVAPQPEEAINALKTGCAASVTDLKTFMEGFLCALGIDSSFATDTDIQNDVDNLANMDTSNLPESCASISSL